MYVPSSLKAFIKDLQILIFISYNFISIVSNTVLRGGETFDATYVVYVTLFIDPLDLFYIIVFVN